MSTLDLINAARPSVVRPPWAAKDQLGERCIGILWEPARGELTLAAAAGRLDECAQQRGWAVGEVCRVRKGDFEGIYARPAPPTVVEGDKA